MVRKNFFVFCLMFFALSFGVAAMAALVPSLAVSFKVPLHSAQRLTWLYMLPYGLFALVWAPLTRVVKVKKLLFFAALGYCFSTLLFSLSSNINQAYLFRFLMGIFGCGFVPVVLITIGKSVSSEKKAKYIGIFFAVSYISTLISVFLSGFVNWRIIYFIPALLSAVVIIFISSHLHDFDFRMEKFKLSYFDTFKDKQAARFFLVIMLASFLYHSLQQRLGVYLSSEYSLSQMVISSILTVGAFYAISFEFMGGFLSKRFGNIGISRSGFIMMSIFILFLLFIKNYPMIFWVVGLWGAGWALTHIGLSSHLADFPDKILCDASGLNSSLRFSFGGLGSLCGGFIVSLVGFKAHFLIVGISIFLLGFYLNRIITVKDPGY
ncbi:MAG: MFS transporter [Candidatus Omnitrophota bacterium]